MPSLRLWYGHNIRMVKRPDHGVWQRPRQFGGRRGRGLCARKVHSAERSELPRTVVMMSGSLVRERKRGGSNGFKEMVAMLCRPSSRCRVQVNPPEVDRWKAQNDLSAIAPTPNATGGGLHEPGGCLPDNQLFSGGLAEHPLMRGLENNQYAVAGWRLGTHRPEVHRAGLPGIGCAKG